MISKKSALPDLGLIAANNSILELERSSKWDEVQKAHIKKHPYCVACGKDVKYPNNNGLQVHHIIPFHFCTELGRPDLELDERNLMTLCETEDDIKTPNHHLLIGHLGDWQSYNGTAKKDAISTFHGLKQSEIKSNSLWKKMRAGKPAHLNKLTEKEKKELKAYMNKRFPKKK